MKKLQSFLSLLLLFGFLSSTTGINVYKHYCGDFLAEISFFVKSNPCADESGEDTCSVGKEMDCCEDESEFYQLDTQLIKQSSTYEGLELSPSQIHLFHSVLTIPKQREIEISLYEPPPLLYNNHLYQEFHQLIFYG
ncbi:MAG: hypothetical protein ACJAV5_000759 [Vicingaceae bacterium]